MRFRLTIADPAPAVRSHPGLSDVLVEAPPGTTWADLQPRLAPHAGLSAPDSAEFAVDGEVVRGTMLVGERPLVEGAVLTLVRGGTPSRMPLGSAALVELALVGGPGAGRTVRLGRGEHVVGRGPHSAVRLDDPGVSRAHSLVTVDDRGVTVRDLEPTNPSTLDGEPVPPEGATVRPGSRLRLASTTLVLGSMPPRPAAVVVGEGAVRVHRPPRFVAPAQHGAIAFPEAPRPPDGLRVPLLASLAPVVISAALAIALQSPAMLLFAFLSPVMLLGQWWSDRRHGRRSHRAELADHTRQTDAATRALAEAIATEECARRLEHPDLGTVLAVATRPGARLWERRPGDPDHLVVRFGSATQATRVEVTGPAPPNTLRSAADVPATINLAESGVVGIAGPRVRTLSVASGILAQLCTWHTPRNLRLVLLTNSSAAQRDWGWATALPHLRGDDSCLVALGDTAHEPTVARRVAEVSRLIAQRQESVRDIGGREVAHAPVLVVLDGAGHLRREPGVADLLRAGPAVGVSFLCVDAASDVLPVETTVLVEVGDGTRPEATLTSRTAVIEDVVPDLPEPAWVERLARALAPLQDATPDDAQAVLPGGVGFRQVHLDAGIDPTSAGALATHWGRGSTGSRPASAIIGAAADGPVVVDLALDGPHALVGGTTGSGKSELLQTLVAGLAVGSRPDELGFVLVDYKGGSAFKECASLPHTLGVVTDLDEHLTSRALTSLGAELKRRERLLAEAGAKDLDDLRRLRERDPAAPLPDIARLVIVVDEFKMLADELPDFIAGLVRIAAIGRSLGVHLVLATQRPAGIVSGDMRANISLRIALRVRDRTDSDDVIESPLAASISDRAPGRAFLRAGARPLVEVQTAHVGAPSFGPSASSEGSGVAQPAPTIDVWAVGWGDLGLPPPVPVKAASDAERTELADVVEAARAAARQLAIVTPASPWLPALPESVRAESLESPAGGSAPLGLCDHPREQRQTVASWSPADDGNLGIAGGARSGRSTALRTLALALAERHSPAELHLHVIEGTSGSLSDLAALPHVGSVTGAADPVLARRVVQRLTLVAASPDSRRPGRPLTVVVVDGWEAIEDAFAEVDHGASTDDLLRLMRDGHAAGIRFVVAGGRAVISSRLTGVLERRLVLAMPDPLDLTLAGLPASAASLSRPPGRALEVSTGVEVQLAFTGATPLFDEQRRATEAAAGLARLAGQQVPLDQLPWRVQRLPDMVRLDSLAPTSTDLGQPGGGFVPLGLGGDDARIVGLDVDVYRRVVVVGPPRSGRSGTLAVIATRLAGSGRDIAVVAARRSPLTALSGIPDVHVLSADDDAFVALRREHPDLVVVVDDADSLEGTRIENALVEAARLVDRAEGVFVVAVDVGRASGLFSGLVPEVARRAAGVVLSPASPADGDLLGVRVEVARERRPGRGLLVHDGITTPIQVAHQPSYAARPAST